MAEVTLAAVLGLYGSRQAAALPHHDLAPNTGAKQFLAPLRTLASYHLSQATKGIKQRNTSAEFHRCLEDFERYRERQFHLDQEYKRGLIFLVLAVRFVQPAGW